MMWSTPRKWMMMLLFAGAIALMAGCEGDAETDQSSSDSTSDSSSSTSTTAPVNLTMSASADTATTALSRALTVADGIEISDFQISIREVRFKLESEDLTATDGTTEDTSADSVDFEGPYLIDLVSTDSVLAQSIGDAEIPADTYDGIRFVMHKTDAADLADPNDPLADRSIYIAGTIDKGDGAGPIEFEMWHDTGENFDITGVNGIVVDENGVNDMVVDFHLNTVLSGVDLFTAELDATTGTYLIHRASDSDINGDLADQLKENIKTAADFGKDADGDGVLGDDEDVEDETADGTTDPA